MSLTLQLQSVSEWVTTLSKAAKDTIEFSFESGLLQDTLNEICLRAGVAGSVFKLGAMLIPDPDAETIIGATLSKTFLKALDEKFLEEKDLIDEKSWRTYQKEYLEDAASKSLSSQFTWLKIIGQKGRKSSRSWPVVHELADFSYEIVWGTAKLNEDNSLSDIAHFASEVRGYVHEKLASSVDKLVANPKIEDAFKIEMPKASREALELLSKEYTTLNRKPLFEEVPQNELFISPRIRVIDYSDSEPESNWENIDPLNDGSSYLVEEVLSNKNSSKIIVIVGEMGVGKSCLMRDLVSRLSSKYIEDRSEAVLFANWRDIYNDSNLIDGIANHIRFQYGLPLPNLKTEEHLIFMIDGFDEMRSHEPATVETYFDSLIRLSNSHESTLVVGMRSTLITDNLIRRWKDNNVLAVKVDEFCDDDVDVWVGKWCKYRNLEGITGNDLRSLCMGSSDLIHNPLLLFMMARYVYPNVKDGTELLSRAEIFRRFVDETIAGKARTSGESADIEVNRVNYRYLLQEIAWISSWPKCGGVCPLNYIKDRVGSEVADNFSINDIRSAFVLHFFEPGDHLNEFEFHPEGFRHYLLAEWCVRTQFDALQNIDYQPEYPTGRDRNEAIESLSQFPVREVERDLLNELYEQIPKWLNADDEIVREQTKNTFAIRGETSLEKLYERCLKQANVPELPLTHGDNRVGEQEFCKNIKSLEQTRLLANYWDQSMLATFGLYRGLEKNINEDHIFSVNNMAFKQLSSLIGATRGMFDVNIYKLDRLGLFEVFLSNEVLTSKNISNSNLDKADLSRAYLYKAKFNNSTFKRANLRYSWLANSDFSGADMRNARVSASDLEESNLKGAVLIASDFSLCNMQNVDLRGAEIQSADLRKANLSNSNLQDANLRGANLDSVILVGANLEGVNLLKARVNSMDWFEKLKELDPPPKGIDFRKWKVEFSDERGFNKYIIKLSDS